MIGQGITIKTGRWQRRFLDILPAIVRYARLRSRGLRPEAQEEFVQEIVANCCVACCRLAQRRKLAAAFPTPLVRYAVAQIRGGRRVGGRLNSHDVASEYAQRRNDLQLEHLDHRDRQNEWRTALVEDRRTPVDRQVAFRIDFPAWLARLAPRQRQIAKFLAVGNSTSDAADRFGISPGRISQLRQELQRDWLQFHGEKTPRRTDRSAA